MTSGAAKCVTAVCLIIATGLGALLWLQSPAHLSAAEQRLVGVWRRYDSAGRALEDTWYKPNRTAWTRGLSESEWDSARTNGPRWQLNNGKIQWRKWTALDERLFGVGLLRIAQNCFQFEAARRSGCKNSLRRLGLALHCYDSLIRADFGEAHRDRVFVPAGDWYGEQTLVRIDPATPPISASATQSTPTGWGVGRADVASRSD